MRTVVLVDMDGVLADFDRRFIEIWHDKYPDQLQLDQGNRSSFKIAEEFPAAMQASIRCVFSSPGFYRSLPPITGAVEGMGELAAAGYDVWICTSPLSEYENCVLEKYQWVEEHLGRKWTERIIITKRKSLVAGRFLIDDHPAIDDSENAAWEHILFDAPYNRHIGQLKRMTWASWREVLRLQ